MTLDREKSMKEGIEWTETSKASKLKEIRDEIDKNIRIKGVDELRDFIENKKYQEFQIKIGMPGKSCDGKLGKLTLEKLNEYIRRQSYRGEIINILDNKDSESIKWTETSKASKLKEIREIIEKNSEIKGVKKLKELIESQQYQELQRQLGLQGKNCDGKLGKLTLEKLMIYIKDNKNKGISRNIEGGYEAFVEWTDKSKNSKLKEIKDFLKSLQQKENYRKLYDLLLSKKYKEFQEKIGIKAEECDGKLGNNTLIKLKKYSSNEMFEESVLQEQKTLDENSPNEDNTNQEGTKGTTREEPIEIVDQTDGGKDISSWGKVVGTLKGFLKKGKGAKKEDKLGGKPHEIEKATPKLIKECYNSGNIKAEGAYINGKKEGLRKEYSYCGRTIVREGEYKEGKKEGMWKEYYDGGQVIEEGAYKNGEKIGEWKEYYDDGRIKFKRMFNSKGDQSSEFYDTDGYLIEKKVFKNRTLFTTYYFRNGLRWEVSREFNKDAKYKEYDLNGNLTHEGRYGDNYFTGERIQDFRDGKVNDTETQEPFLNQKIQVDFNNYHKFHLDRNDIVIIRDKLEDPQDRTYDRPNGKNLSTKISELIYYLNPYVFGTSQEEKDIINREKSLVLLKLCIENPNDKLAKDILKLAKKL